MHKLLKYFFHFLYHELAGLYDLVSTIVSLGHWNQWRSAIMPSVKGIRVLEVGFGTGHLQTELTEAGFVTFGVDESLQMSRLARKEIEKFGYQPKLIRGLAQNLPLASGIFDTFLTTFPSEFIFDHRALAEAHRVLKLNGRFIAIPMAFIGGNTIQERAAAWLFKVTGESVEVSDEFMQRIFSIFNLAGFQVKIVQKKLASDVVIIIIGEKLNFNKDD